MSDEARNVEILKAAYKRWTDSKGGSVDDWMKICADNIAFGSLAQGAPQGAQYLTAYQQPRRAEGVFRRPCRDWQMIEFGRSISSPRATASSCWAVAPGATRRTARWCRRRRPMPGGCRGGKAVEFFEYYDTAQVHAAVV